MDQDPAGSSDSEDEASGRSEALTSLSAPDKVRVGHRWDDSLFAVCLKAGSAGLSEVDT